MTDKKRYYGLDEIGFVGTQGKKKERELKRDIEMTVQYIKNKKKSKVIPMEKSRTIPLKKTK